VENPINISITLSSFIGETTRIDISVSQAIKREITYMMRMRVQESLKNAFVRFKKLILMIARKRLPSS
jgi:hypothetical protein